MNKQDTDSVFTFIGIVFILALLGAMCSRGPASHWQIEDNDSWGPEIRDR